MSGSILMAVVYVLGFSPADGTAVCFGTEESGAFAPAAFEARRHSPGTAKALKGVRTLVFDAEVSEIGAGAFAGAPDLETVCFEGDVSSLGARAFADAPKLTCVVFSSRNPVDACVDTFAGAHAQLTAVYPRDSYGPIEVMHPMSIWKNMVSAGKGWNGIRTLSCADMPAIATPGRAWPRADIAGVRYEGPRVTADGWLFRINEGCAKLLAYLPTDRSAVELPSRIDGFDTTCRDYGDSHTPPEEIKIGKLLADASSLEDLKGVGGHRILANGGCAYVRLADPRALSGSSLNGECVPECTTLSDIAALTNGIPSESGYRYIVLGGEVAAILGIDGARTLNAHFSPRPIPNGGKGESVVVPATLGGKPVTRLPPGLFASRYDISSVSFPDTIEELPAGVCYGCPILGEVKLPTCLKRIGRLAFFDCPRLSAPLLPEGVVCESWAFDNKPTDGNHVILKP